MLVQADLTCCLADFGLALVAETQSLLSATLSTAGKGTLRWMAPELLQGQKAQKESDIYALGCTALEVSDMVAYLQIF